MKKFINLIKSQLLLQKNTSHKAAKELSIPTVNRRSTDGQSQREAKATLPFREGMGVGFLHYAAMVTLLLTLACGEMWGAYDVPANSTVTLSTKVNNGGRFNVEASGVYHFRKSSGYSWSDGNGIKTQSNQCGVVFYLNASKEIEVGIKHTESKNAHDVTVHVYSIPESEYKQFDDNKAGAAESDRTFSTGPSTSTDNSFTISVTAESKTFKGSKTLSAGYYAIVPVGEKSNTYFNSIKFSAAAVCGETAQAALTLSSSSGTICAGSTTTFTVSGGSGSGALSVSSSDETKATATIDGSTVTVTGVAAGSATITVTKACDATYAEKTATYSATVAAAPTANAGADKTTEPSTGVALAATAATSGCTGAWTIQSGPNTSTSQLSSTSSATATFTPTVAGTYTLRWTVTNTSTTCSAYDEMKVTAATCAISECGNATLTYVINSGSSGSNATDASDLISSATASNTTAMGISSTAGKNTITISDTRKAAAATSACYGSAPNMSSKISMYEGAAYNSSNYLQFQFEVKSGYTFTPCDIKFTVQPVSAAGNFRWEVTDGTNVYGYGVAENVSKGSEGGASVMTGLGSTETMSAGTYYIRLYPYCSSSNTFRISNDVILKGTTATAGCASYSFHYGTDGQSDWTTTCFVTQGGEHEMQVTDFTIPSKTHFYVGKQGSYSGTSGNASDANSVTTTWSSMYFAKSIGDGTGTRPMLGQATGATGTIRIYDNSTWNNKQAAFIPDGYKLKVGSTEYAFTLETGNEYRSDIVELSSTNARSNISVGITNSSGNYVATDNTQEMQHIFLNTGGSTYWEADGVSNFGLFDVTNDGWACLMVRVPGESNLFEGWVPSNCTTVSIHRLKSSDLKWKTNDSDGSNTNVYNSTNNLVLQANQNKWTVTGWGGGDGSWSAYEKKGKFRINDDWTDKNWYVRFYPYYVLTYDANGGSDAPAAQSVAPDAVPCQWTLSTTQPTRSGYTFLGWSTNSVATEPDAGKAVANLGTPFGASGDLTLYAVWQCTTPTFGTNLSTSTVNYTQDASASALTVAATAASGTVTYQWYSNDENNTTTPTILTGQTSASYTPSTASVGTTYYYCVATNSTAGCSTTATSNITPVTVAAAAVLTAMECNTLYKVGDMVPSGYTLTSDEQYGAGLSANTYFETLGDPSKTSSAGGAPEMKNISSVTIDGTSFGAAMYLKRAAELSSSLPTSHAIKFIIPSSGTLDIYLKRSDRLYLIKEGSSAESLGSSDSNEKVSKNVTAGTYYIYANNTNTCIYGIKLNCCSDPVINEGTTRTSFAGGSWAQNSGHTITITATGADSYEWYRNTSATDAGATKLSETSNTLDITAGVAAGTYFYKAIAKSGACSSSTEWGWCGAMTITAVTYSITYNCNGAESGCPSNVAAASNLPSPLPTGLTKDGYDFGGWFTDSECTVAAVAGATLTGNTDLYAKWTEHIASECITITNFETSQHSNSSNKPDSQGKYIYGYMTTVDAEHAVTITMSNTNNKGQNSNADMLIHYGSSIYIYADNTTTGGTPATFSNVVSISLKIKNKHATDKSNFTIKVGSTTVANAVSLVDANNSTYTTYTYNNLSQLSGKIEIHNGGSGSTNFNFFVDDIEICTADMSSCTTPVIPSLSNQSLCSGANATAWDATVTNAAAISAAGETVSYQWQLKNGSNWDNISGATSASYDVSDAVTEAMAGTYRVLVTVSKAGYSSSSATREVTLSVTESTEVTGITANKATVYPGNSVTLTATANTTVTWQWYTCSNAEGDGESSIGGATNASYAIASAPAAGTHYYKVKATSSCGTASLVYALTVSEPSTCIEWKGTPNSLSNSSMTVNENLILSVSGASINTAAVWSGSGNVTHFQINSANYYVEGHFADGSDISSVTVSAATNQSSSKAYALVFSPDNAFSTGLTVYTHSAPSANATKNESNLVHEFTAPANTKYFRIYRKFTYSATDYGDNQTIRVYGIEACAASSCTDATPTIAAVNNTVCSGTKMRIDATGYETGATFKWQKLNGSAWEDVAGETKDSLVINPAAAANAGSYRFIATKGCARTSNTVTIAVPSAPVFGDVPSSVSVMQTLALSISTVEATDAVKYKWYKSADATWDAGDAEIGTEKNLIKAYDGETAGSTYYIFCRAQNACGITTSSAITVTVTAYVEEDCATRGNEGEAQFGFDYGSAGQGSYSSTACWTMNQNSKILTYTAPTGKYFKTAKVTIASSSESKASYNWSTNAGSTYTGVALTVNSTLTERTIDLSLHGNVDKFQIGRNFDSKGSSGGTLYVSKICFEYTEACTATTVTVSGTGSETYTSGDFTEPTFTVKHGGTAFDPQPTITYTSSNEDIATVDDDGTVTFQGLAGTVKITASYAGGTISATDYCASEGYYTITVSCSAGTPSIAASGSTNLSGCNASVTLTASGVTSGGSYQWFRGGEEVDGATDASITVTQAGTYTVEYTKDGCTALSSNSIAVTSEATQPEVERLVPFQYYHVDKTYTAQMKMRHLFAVKNSGKLDGKSFKLYVSRNGSAATDVTNSNALAIWTNADGRVDTVMIDLNKLSGKYAENDELVYTCKAIDCSGNVSNVYKNTITMNVIGATPTLALICSGSDKEGGTRKTGELTVGGDFLTGYNKADLCEQTGNTSFDASTEWGLYTRLKANYIVTPVNGYAVFKKLNYEPFDILLLTDYPKASKSDAAATVLDDMADLCDYRPMLSFKAHMVAKSPSKWAAKGFTTEPVAVKQGDGRTHLNIVCYAHPMFDGIKDAGEHIFKDNDATGQIVYEMLTGPGHESSKGIQGFEIAAAENFVTIGLIHFNASVTENSPSSGLATWAPTMKDGKSLDRTLVAAVERQTNPEARMIVLAVNCGAQSKFTETGRTIVHKCLQYLLSDYTITPMADCSFTFDNGAHAPHDAEWYQDEENCPGCTGVLGDGKWSTQANWGPDYILRPGKDTEVKIAAPVTVDVTNAVARNARIVEGGHITIPAGKALEVTGTIRHMDGTEISPTDNSEITIGSNSTGNGTLIFNNDMGDSKAVVYMYTTALADVANMSAATSTWQYIGTPHNDVAIATYNYYDSWLYQYDTDQGWVVIPNGGPLVPFRGYCVTHPQAGHTFEMYGKLTATTSADINVPAGKFVVAANSWVAPIDINKFTDDDFEGISDKTIYFFNTGSDTEGNGGTGTAAGTYRASPIKAAAYTGDWQIPSMQGFYIGSTTAGTLHLDYDRHVRQNGGSKVSNPMYAPQRFAEDNEPVVAKLYFRGSRYYDRLVVLEREDFTRGYDSGWDGEAWGGNSASPLSCVSGEGRWDAVSAIPEFEGTVVGFQAGEDNEYRIDFEYSEESEPLYLLDTDNNTYTRVLTGNAYQFTTSDKAYHDRFIFTRNAPSVITGIEPTSDSSQKGSAQKLLINEKVYILRNGVLYDATGKVVK